MRIDTKAIRNIGFVGMLATLPLALEQSSVMAGSQDCGPYFCGMLCPGEGNGAWIEAQGCDYCDGDGCTGGGEGCTRYCYYCNGSWSCV